MSSKNSAYGAAAHNPIRNVLPELPRSRSRSSVEGETAIVLRLRPARWRDAQASPQSTTSTTSAIGAKHAISTRS